MSIKTPIQSILNSPKSKKTKLAILIVAVVVFATYAHSLLFKPTPEELFIDYLYEEIFDKVPFRSNRPVLQVERDEHGAYDITDIILAFPEDKRSGKRLVDIIRKAIPDSGTDERGGNHPYQVNIDKYTLDPRNTDKIVFHIIYNSFWRRFFLNPGIVSIFARYEININIYTVRGEAQETVDAFMLYQGI